MEVSHEKEEQSAQLEPVLPGVQPKDQSWFKKKWLWPMLLGLAAAIVGIVTVINQSGSDAGGGRLAITRTASDHSPGSEVVLYVEGRSSVMVAVDEETLDELIGSLAGRGEQLEALIQSGKVLTLPGNTRVRIVEARLAKLKVRILEGNRIMTEVWVPERWVR